MTVTLIWNTADDTVTVQKDFAPGDVKDGDMIKFVAFDQNRRPVTPLVTFPKGSPFNRSDQPEVIQDTNEHKVIATGKPGNHLDNFACAVIDNGQLHPGGDNLPHPGGR